MGNDEGELCCSRVGREKQLTLGGPRDQGSGSRLLVPPPDTTRREAEEGERGRRCEQGPPLAPERGARADLRQPSEDPLFHREGGVDRGERPLQRRTPGALPFPPHLAAAAGPPVLPGA